MKNTTKKIKVAVLIGTRPEGIKMAPIVEALRGHPLIMPYVISTGQHKEMLKQVFEAFNIQPDHEMNLMEPNQTLSTLTSKICKELSSIFHQGKPDLLLVQGDTTTAMVSALVGFYHKIPVGHIEAGLRSNHRYSPYPEEMNRCLITPLANFHFTPTLEATRNLIDENVDPKTIFEVGNTSVDALLKIASLDLPTENLVPFDLSKHKMILVTAHRRENFGEGFENICNALIEIANEFPEARIVYPVHLNPNVVDPVYNKLKSIPNIILSPPKDYLQFVQLLKNAYIILTDSGGIQEEAPVLGKPLLVLREVTERPEGIAAGVAKLVGTDREKIVLETRKLMVNPSYYQQMSNSRFLYGKGDAAKKILETLELQFKLIEEESLLLSSI